MSLTPSITPSITPSSPNITPSADVARNITFNYDVCEGEPDRFIVTYKEVVIIDTGFIGSADYTYGGSKRQQFISALIARNIDYSSLTLAIDGYPNIDTSLTGSVTVQLDCPNTRDAYVTVQNPLDELPCWKYTLECPVRVVPLSPSVTPTLSVTPSITQTPVPTVSVTPSSTPDSPAVTPSTSTTATPSATPATSNTPIPSSSPTPSVSITPNSSPIASLTPAATSNISVTPSVSNTPIPSISPTPSATPSA